MDEVPLAVASVTRFQRGSTRAALSSISTSLAKLSCEVAELAESHEKELSSLQEENSRLLSCREDVLSPLVSFAAYNSNIRQAGTAAKDHPDSPSRGCHTDGSRFSSSNCSSASFSSSMRNRNHALNFDSSVSFVSSTKSNPGVYASSQETLTSSISNGDIFAELTEGRDLGKGSVHSLSDSSLASEIPVENSGDLILQDAHLDKNTDMRWLTGVAKRSPNKQSQHHGTRVSLERAPQFKSDQDAPSVKESRKSPMGSPPAVYTIDTCSRPGPTAVGACCASAARAGSPSGGSCAFSQQIPSRGQTASLQVGNFTSTSPMRSSSSMRVGTTAALVDGVAKESCDGKKLAPILRGMCDFAPPHSGSSLMANCETVSGGASTSETSNTPPVLLPRFSVCKVLAFDDDGPDKSGPGASNCHGLVIPSTTNAYKVMRGLAQLLPFEDKERNFCLLQLPFAPTSHFRLLWECFGVLLLTYDMVLVPMQVFDVPKNYFMWLMSWVIMLYWMFDFALSFLSGYYTKSGVLVMQFGHIASHYMKTWLIPDLTILSVDVISVAINISVLGAGAFEFGAEEKGGLSIIRFWKALRFLRFMRLLRIMKLSKSNILEILQEKIMSESLFAACNLVKNMLVLVFVCHVCACLFYFVGTQKYGGYTNWTTEYKYNVHDWLYCYLTSVHWALAQFANGEMVIEPQSIPERLVTLAVLLTSMMFFSAFLAVVGNIVEGYIQRGSKRRNEQWILRVYLRQCGVSWDLKMRVNRYINVLLASTANEVRKADVNYLDLLSKPLQMELQTEQYLKHLTVHPFFLLLSKQSFYVMRGLCCQAVKQVWLSQGDTLFSAGEEVDIMYFVYHGDLAYIKGFDLSNAPEGFNKISANPHSNATSRHHSLPKRASLRSNSTGTKPGAVAMHLGDHKWFCEAALWTERWLTCGAMCANSDCELVGVIGESFHEVMVKHHAAAMTLPREYANAFVKNLNCSINMIGVAALTDVPNLQGVEADKVLRTFSSNSKLHGERAVAEAAAAAAVGIPASAVGNLRPRMSVTSRVSRWRAFT